MVSINKTHKEKIDEATKKVYQAALDACKDDDLDPLELGLITHLAYADALLTCCTAIFEVAGKGMVDSFIEMQKETFRTMHITLKEAFKEKK